MKNIKTFLSFIVPIFITTMYIKFFYEIYYKMNLSIDSTTSVIILNFIIFIIFLLISIEDIINLFKNKSFILESENFQDSDDDGSIYDLEIENIIKNYEWYYFYTADSKSNEKAYYEIKNFVIDEITKKKIEDLDYKIFYSDNIVILKEK